MQGWPAKPTRSLASRLQSAYSPVHAAPLLRCGRSKCLLPGIFVLSAPNMPAANAARRTGSTRSQSARSVDGQ